MIKRLISHVKLILRDGLSVARLKSLLLALRLRGGAGHLLFWAVIIGFAGGITAFAFHHALDYVKFLLLRQIGGFPFTGKYLYGDGLLPPWMFFLIPAAGALASSFLVNKFAAEASGPGTDALVDAFHNKGGRIRSRVPLVKALASILTIGSGGSAGQEGPIAQIGGGLGSAVGEWLKAPDRVRRQLLLAGTSAGLGAIFRAPLGGALTACEILYHEDFESDAFMPSIIASIVAFATFSVLMPGSAPYMLLPLYDLNKPLHLIFCAVLGALCAPASRLYIYVYREACSRFAKLKIPALWKPMLGGLGVGLIGYICPQAVATGWEYLLEAASTSHVGPILIVFALFKILTTSLTIGSGGSGGLFGPSLFIGGMFGGFLGYVFHLIAPHSITEPQAFVLVGMGSFFAGAAKAPIAGVIMVCEMTGNYGLLAPLLLASTIHIVLSKRLSIYTTQKINRFESPAHRSEMTVDVLRDLKVSQVFTPNRRFPSVKHGTTLPELRSLFQSGDEDCFPVLDVNGKLCGLIHAKVLREAFVEPSVENLLIAEDLMNTPRSLSLDTDLHRALQVFLESGANQLPVLSAQSEILGLFRHEEIIRAYDRYLSALNRGESETTMMRSMRG